MMFIVGNAGLSLALVFLFVYPLSNISDKSVNLKLAARMRAVVKRNIAFGVVMISTATANVIADTILWNMMNSNIVENDYLGILVYVFASLDMFCLLVCPRLMTDIWLPERFRQIAWMGYTRLDQGPSDNQSPQAVRSSPQVPSIIIPSPSATTLPALTTDPQIKALDLDDSV